LEKAIDIKRRAQRCIQNGDLDGALREYEKLVSSDDSDPYNFVLLADLLFKRGDTLTAVERYMAAISAYEKAGLYKNAIAVCKKMVRLSLSPAQVLERLAGLHALDGLGTEAALYYLQHAEHLVREDRPQEAAVAMRKAFEASPEDVRTLERLSEVHTLAGETGAAAAAMAEAAHHYAAAGKSGDAERCRARAEQIQSGAVAQFAVRASAPPTERPPAGQATLEHFPLDAPEQVAAQRSAPPMPLTPVAEPSPPNQAEPASAPSGPPAFEVAKSRMEGAAELSAFQPESEESSGADVTPEPQSGLRFERPALEPAAAASDDPAAARLVEIEQLLASAQERFRTGDREGAEGCLIEAAHGYESVGRLENAAAIYRGLARSPRAGTELLEIWLANCQQRDDRREAAEVACEIGDRRLQDDDLEGARTWFEKACALAPDHALARRRLERLVEMRSGAAAVPASVQPAWNGTQGGVAADAEPEPTVAMPRAEHRLTVPPVPDAEPGRVEMAVGRGEAVTFDLGSLLAEFQRGIEAQLSGDPQSHYDLAMAYREMELYEQAVESFRIAGGDPKFRQRSAEMTGLCLAALGRHEEAVRELRVALESVAPASEGTVDLRYQLGLALEAAGRTGDALVELEQVAAARPQDSDVTHKLNALRNAAGQG
jgi:tetratricopeptide (TPR) repeat protein